METDDMNYEVHREWTGDFGETIRIKFVEAHERTENKRIILFEVENSPLSEQEDGLIYMAVEIPEGVTFGDVGMDLTGHMVTAYNRSLKDKGFLTPKQMLDKSR